MHQASRGCESPTSATLTTELPYRAPQAIRRYKTFSQRLLAAALAYPEGTERSSTGVSSCFCPVFCLGIPVYYPKKPAEAGALALEVVLFLLGTTPRGPKTFRSLGFLILFLWSYRATSRQILPTLRPKVYKQDPAFC